MTTFDLTLASLRLAGLKNFHPEFGTKEADDTGVSTENMCRNFMLPFQKQRPLQVSEDSDTTELQTDARFIFTTSGITLTLGAAAYSGCRVLVRGKFQTGTARIEYSEKYVLLAAGEQIEFIADDNGNFMLVDYSQSHNIPRKTPKDITAYYNDGTIYQRLAGTNGFSKYEDIFAGDYFRMSRPISAYNKVTEYQRTGSQYVTIAGISTLKGNGDTIDMNFEHLVMVPGQGFGGTQHFGRARMNPTNTTEGGYKASEMNTETIGAVATAGNTGTTATINQQLFAEFGSHLKTTRELITNGINPNGNNRFGSASGCSSGWEWADCQAILMSETECYGSIAWSSSAHDTGNANYQLPLFFFNNQARNNRSAWYWLKDIASSAYFCAATGNGYSLYYRASLADFYVRPRFVIA